MPLSRPCSLPLLMLGPAVAPQAQAPLSMPKPTAAGATDLVPNLGIWEQEPGRLVLVTWLQRARFDYTGIPGRARSPGTTVPTCASS